MKKEIVKELSALDRSFESSSEILKKFDFLCEKYGTEMIATHLIYLNLKNLNKVLDV